MKRISRYFFLLGALALAFSCTDFKEADVPTGLSVDPTELSFSSEAGSQTVTVRSGSKWTVGSKPDWVSVPSITESGADYQWSVVFSATANDGYYRDGVISISSGSGSALITVTQQGRKGKYVAVESIELNHKTLTMYVDDSQSLTVAISPSNATDKTVSWSSSDENVVKVISSGFLSAKSVGTATVTATAADGKSATCVVTVKAKTIPVTGVTLDKTSLTMTEGDTQTLTATLAPTNASNKNVTWSSSNTTVATVSSAGVVTAKAAGNATITVTTADGSKTASCIVTVVSKKPVIQFADSNLKQYLLSYYDTDGDSEISYEEAEAVTSIVTLASVKSVVSFDEFQFFTNVQSVPEGWLQNCQNLRSVVLPPAVKTIGASAFENCNSLTSINLNKEIQVDAKAFKGTSLSGAIHVASFKSDAFAGTAVTDIYEHSSNIKDYKGFDDCLLSIPTTCTIRLLPSVHTSLSDYIGQVNGGFDGSIRGSNAAILSIITGFMTRLAQIEAEIKRMSATSDFSQYEQIQASLASLKSDVNAYSVLWSGLLEDTQDAIMDCSDYFQIALDFLDLLNDVRSQMSADLDELSARITMCEASLQMISHAPAHSAPKRSGTRSSGASYTVDQIVSLFTNHVAVFSE